MALLLRMCIIYHILYTQTIRVDTQKYLINYCWLPWPHPEAQGTAISTRGAHDHATIKSQQEMKNKEIAQKKFITGPLFVSKPFVIPPKSPKKELLKQTMELQGRHAEKHKERRAASTQWTASVRMWI